MKAISIGITVSVAIMAPLWAGCEQTESQNLPEALEAKGCIPGERQECACNAGNDGFQFCTEEGVAWSECFCSWAATAAPALPPGLKPGLSLPMGNERQSDRLAVVWYSGDPMVAERLALMYTKYSKTSGWFDTVELIIWGPSQPLVVNNSSVQSEVQSLMQAGVIVEACKACADMYGVADDLSALGITVKYMGQPLSDMLKGGWHVLTF